MCETPHHLDRQDWLWILLLVILAALLRLPALDRFPPGFQFDEAYNSLDALDVLEGNLPVFLGENGGREALYTYLQTPLVYLFGPTAAAGRLASALIGIITISILYVFVRRVFPEHRRVAVLAGTLLTLSYWHLHFSRYGIRSILTPLWFLLTWLAFWRGLEENKPGWYALCGVWMAANVWTHPVGRLAPLMILVMVALALAAYRERWRSLVGGTLIAGTVSALLFAPLAWYYAHNLVQFYAHAGDVSIIQPGDWSCSLVALAQNTWRVLLMFNIQGDAEWIHNWPGRPVFDPLVGIAFLVGMGLLLHRAFQNDRRGRLPYWLLLVWAVLLAVVSIATDMAPNYSRMIGALPVFVIAAAIGLDRLMELVEHHSSKIVAVIGIAVVLAASGGSTLYGYFVRFGTDSRTFYDYDKDKIEAATYLSEMANENTVFLAELWAQHATIRLLTRSAGIRSLDAGAAVVIPSGESKGVLYAFPPEQRESAEALKAVWGDWGELYTIEDAQGQPLLHLFSISREQRDALTSDPAFVAEQVLGDLHPVDVALSKGIRLHGWRVADQPDADGNLTITLLWECTDTVHQDYTAYVHFVDANQAKIAQVDQQPGAGSYKTSEWHVGDFIVDQYQVLLPTIMPASTYAVQVGFYQLLAVDGTYQQIPMGSSDLGEFRFRGGIPSQAYVLPKGATTIRDGNGVIAVIIPDRIELLTPTPLTLILDPEIATEGGEWVLSLVGSNSEEQFTLDTLESPGNPEWDNVEWLALTVNSTAEGIPPAHYRLQLERRPDGPTVILGTSEVVASQRLWELPVIDIPMDAVLGDWVKLQGISSPKLHDGVLQVAAGRDLEITLVWQVETGTNDSLSTFLHLVDSGNILAQHDGVPQEGSYPTTLWISGEVVLDEISLHVPEDAPPGTTYQLLLGLYDTSTGLRQTVVQDGQQVPGASVAVPIPVSIGGAEP